MTTPEDDKLIERLARAACEAMNADPEATALNDRSTGRRVTMLEYYQQEARRHLAMQREYEREMAARHEAWTHEMIATAPKQAETECDHEWLRATGGTDPTVAMYCVKCGQSRRITRTPKDTDQ